MRKGTVKRRDPITDIALAVIICLVVLGVVALIVYLSTKIPCDFYRFRTTSGVPARCLSHFTN